VIFVGDSRDSERASACGVRARAAAPDAAHPAGSSAPAAAESDFVKALRLSDITLELRDVAVNDQYLPLDLGRHFDITRKYLLRPVPAFVKVAVDGPKISYSGGKAGGRFRFIFNRPAQCRTQVVMFFLEAV